MELPFLVVHGAWLWKVWLLALVGITYAASWGLRVALARRRARRDIAGRAARASAPHAGDVMLTGTLRDGSIAKLERYDHREHHVTGSPWVDCGGARVELPETIVLLRGSVERRSMQPPAGTPAPLAEAAKGKPVPVDASIWRHDYSLQTLADGDAVTISGTLAPKPAAAEAASYREGEVAWTFEGAATIASTAPRATPIRYHVALRVMFAIGACLACYGALYKLGKHAMRQSHDYSELAFTPERLADAWWLQLAAALPKSRERALYELRERANRYRERSERGLRFAETLDELFDERCKRVGRAFQDMRYEDALAAARECGDPEQELSALRYLGEYTAAVAHPAYGDSPEIDLSVAIAAGAWKRAAAIADGIATVDASADDFTQRRAKRAACMATLFRHHAGEPVELVAPRGDALCMMVRALQGPADQRKAELEAIAFGDRDSGLSLLNRELVRLHGGEPPSWSSIGADAIVEAAREGYRLPWLSLFMTDDRSAFERYALQLVTAPTKLPSYDSVVVPREGRMYDYSNRIAIALRTGAPLPPAVPSDYKQGYVHPGLARMVAMRRGEALPDFILMVRPDRCERRFHDAQLAAQRGDGAPLAAVLRECEIRGSNLDELFLGVLPLVQHGRAELAEALRFPREQSTLYFKYPFMWLHDAAARRDVSRLAGDETSAQRWQRTVERLAAPLADRDRSIALHLWSDR